MAQVFLEKETEHEFCTNCQARLDGYRAIGSKYVLLARPKINLRKKSNSYGHKGATIIDCADTLEEAQSKASRGIKQKNFVVEILLLDGNNGTNDTH